MNSSLEMMLTEIGRSVEWPEPSTGFSQRVISRINAQVPRRSRLRRAVLAFSALGAIVATVLTFSPATRNAVADYIGVGGVHIEFDGRPDLPKSQTGESLRLGDPVTLNEAEAAVDFEIVMPSSSDLGDPDQIYLDEIMPSEGMISLVYGERDGYEVSGTSGVSVLITEFSGQLEFFKKVMARSTVEVVEVNGGEGYWISGAPHSFLYRSNGRVSEESIRLVENVLLWVDDGVTLRIETAGSLEQALTIAQSLV